MKPAESATADWEVLPFEVGSEKFKELFQTIQIENTLPENRQRVFYLV